MIAKYPECHHKGVKTMIVAEIRKITVTADSNTDTPLSLETCSPTISSNVFSLVMVSLYLNLKLCQNAFLPFFFIVRTFYIYIKPSGTSTVSKRFFLSNLMINSSWAGSKSSSPSFSMAKRTFIVLSSTATISPNSP